MDTLKILGKNIKYYRTQLDLTQEELANLSGVNRSHLAGIETGSLNPSIKTVGKLAEALNISVADLFCEKDG
ncbi:helix-turn-helix domain-containing protein [Chloroflexota bacterium]